MVNFKYYNTGAPFDSTSLQSDDIAFVADTNSLFTHGKEYKFITDVILNTKQDVLTAGINVKTVNGQSLLGGGNIDIYAPSTADINLNGSVITVTNNAAEESSLDLEDAIEDAVYNVVVTQEVVQIAVTVAADAPQGTTASGLVINAYYNDASVPSAQTTTDANGMAVLRVPAGYKYKLVFPSQHGCNPIPDVVHTASIPQRSVELEY